MILLQALTFISVVAVVLIIGLAVFQPAMKTWSGALSGMESTLSSDSKNLSVGKCYIGKRAFNITIQGKTEGLLIHNKLAPSINNVLINWEAISIIKYYSNQGLAKLIYSNGQTEHEITVPWVKSFTSLVPVSASYNEL
jgi:hypothetical protein